MVRPRVVRSGDSGGISSGAREQKISFQQRLDERLAQVRRRAGMGSPLLKVGSYQKVVGIEVLTRTCYERQNPQNEIPTNAYVSSGKPYPPIPRSILKTAGTKSKSIYSSSTH